MLENISSESTNNFLKTQAFQAPETGKIMDDEFFI